VQHLVSVEHADVDVVDAVNMHALEWATLGQHLHVMDYLLHAGARRMADTSPLHIAATWDWIEALDLLMEYKADVNLVSVDLGKATPLLAAASNGRVRAVAFLMSNGADATLVGDSGMTASEVAESMQSDQIAKALKTKPAKRKGMRKETTKLLEAMKKNAPLGHASAADKPDAKSSNGKNDAKGQAVSSQTAAKPLPIATSAPTQGRVATAAPSAAAAGKCDLPRVDGSKMTLAEWNSKFRDKQGVVLTNLDENFKKLAGIFANDESVEKSCAPPQGERIRTPCEICTGAGTRKRRCLRGKSLGQLETGSLSTSICSSLTSRRCLSAPYCACVH
jgi:hypothetical protein